MVEPFAMASSPATLVTIATALFVTVTVARPPTLSPSLSPCHPHPPCCLPPSLLPQLSPPPSPLLLLTPHPCLLVACNLHCRHSRCRRHRLCCRSPCTLVSVAIPPATVASAIVIARHPRCHRNHPLCHLRLPSPATLIAIALPWVGERRTVPTSGLLLAFV